ncbi:putative short-chain dehydrogenases/reductase [Xylaria cf. heliscus]|nr:putative short-chain dehydrogenases/reductase [Xylaria cf. heliscus]
MVALTDIIASNERIASALPAGLVAVFVGGTSGVGEYTLKAFARYARAPKVIIVGRSQEAADRILGECRGLNPDGHFEFIRADVSLLKNVDDVCRQIREKVAVVNILFESQGSMAFQSETSEGLPTVTALATHSRLRFITNLLPLLQLAPSLRRVVSVGAATCEGAIDMDNFSGAGFPLQKWRDQVAAIMTLTLERTQSRRRAPDVAFVHTVPGVVESGIMRDVQPTLRLSIIIAIARLLGPLINVPPAECGERHVFAATSAAFAPAQGAGCGGVPLDGTAIEIARGTDGKAGSGVYSLSQKLDPAPPKVEEVLRRFREDGTAGKVWDAIAADFKRITGSEVAA